jgi:hypothetical protein
LPLLEQQQLHCRIMHIKHLLYCCQKRLQHWLTAGIIVITTSSAQLRCSASSTVAAAAAAAFLQSCCASCKVLQEGLQP